MAHGRSFPLLIMLLALAAGRGVSGQMLPVPSSGTGTPAGGEGTGERLYVSAEPEPGEGAPRAASGAGGASVVVLPPPPKRVRDLPGVRPADRVKPFRAVAFAVTASTLGAGAEMAMPIARRWNVRVGGSYLDWAYPLNKDGIAYQPQLKFLAGRGTVDWFPHGNAFHVSAGALYFRNTISGSAAVGVGQSFTLGGTTYINSVDDPVSGTARVSYGKRVAPAVLLGLGNVLPRSGRHVSVPVEIGGAYLQVPVLTMQLAGTACTTQGCFNAATSPEVQTNLHAEEVKLQSKFNFLKVYPLVSVGVSCRF